ncbi:unnamed protein product [Rangifer tarandus platyrhynchus]|uniref:Uncharacterized protein n=2 Tax=Rangifer tarandus platyrhynchus TaxID=3082113 RepID=A0ACB0E5D2_RANTA|nr:unnamed protein product [Rangifer tarandus platyrhynchus]CAI9695837.1 unnamed protein product [Rangifer tarandus platyrhynchus]
MQFPGSSLLSLRQHVQVGQLGYSPQEGGGALPNGGPGAVATVPPELLSLEEQHGSREFHSQVLEDSDSDLRVSWCAGANMGKTTFIRHMMKKGLMALRCGAKHTIDPFATATQPSLTRTRWPAMRS